MSNKHAPIGIDEYYAAQLRLADMMAMAESAEQAFDKLLSAFYAYEEKRNRLQRIFKRHSWLCEKYRTRIKNAGVAFENLRVALREMGISIADVKDG